MAVRDKVLSLNMLPALIAKAPLLYQTLSESIRTVIERNPAMRAGEVYLLNDPYHGGTHLPDVTVVTPVYLEPPADARGRVIFIPDSG